MVAPTLCLCLALALAAPAAARGDEGTKGPQCTHDEKGESKDGKGKEGKEAKEPLSAKTFAGLKLRGIGPAFISGRVADLAVDPRHPSTYYVAAASGGVWKTVNAGTTFEPIFDCE